MQKNKDMWHGSILCKIPENANYRMVTASRSVVASGLGESRAAAGRGKETFGGDRYVYYLDCSYGFTSVYAMSKNLSNCTL